MAKRTIGMKIGRIIGAEMKRKGISYYSAAKRTGMTLTGVQNLVEGRVKHPEYETVFRLAALVGLDMGELAKQLPEAEILPPTGKPGRPRKEKKA